MFMDKDQVILQRIIMYIILLLFRFGSFITLYVLQYTSTYITLNLQKNTKHLAVIFIQWCQIKRDF